MLSLGPGGSDTFNSRKGSVFLLLGTTEVKAKAPSVGGWRAALSAKTRRGERESRAKDDQDARFEVSGGQMGLV